MMIAEPSRAAEPKLCLLEETQIVLRIGITIAGHLQQLFDMLLTLLGGQGLIPSQYKTVETFGGSFFDQLRPVRKAQLLIHRVVSAR